MSWSDIRRLQKGHHFTSYVNKPLEDLLVYLFAKLGFISADHITIMANVLAFYAVYLILTGRWDTGLVVMLIVTILDGVDGKLARLKGTPTKIGKLEHSLDFLYEQAWYVSLILIAYTSSNNIWVLGAGLAWLVADGYVRHVYNLGWIVVGFPLKNWGRIGRLVTIIDGRRNVYVWYAAISYVITGGFTLSIYLSLAHALATVLVYTILTQMQISQVVKQQ